MTKKLISLNELKRGDLPLTLGEDILFIKEADLELFLTTQRYNIYRNIENLTYQKVLDQDWVLDSTLINDAMFDLGFEAVENEDGDRVFYLPKSEM